MNFKKIKNIIFSVCLIIFLSPSNSTAHEHLSNLNDITICLGKSGEGITSIQFEFVKQYEDKLRTKTAELATKRRGDDYVLEAFNRNLDWSKCKNLISESVPLIENNSTLTSSNSMTKDRSTEKAKLKELKSLLDDGLISQEQYDDKSSMIDSSSVKAKLRELKSLLDDGLISQEQYDDKSSKILDEF